MSLEEFINDVIGPMFPGITVAASTERISWRKKSRVVYAAGGRELRIRESASASRWFTLSRRQPFERSEKNLIHHLIRSYVRTKARAEVFLEHLEETITRTAIAASLSGARLHRDVIARVLECYSGWATQTYEGERVSSGVVVENNDLSSDGDFSFEALVHEDFSKALTDGVDSWWVLDRRDAVVDFEIASNELFDDPNAFYPLRYAAIAQRSQNGAVGVVLNRNGEILIFVNLELRFAKRRGAWVHFAHRSIIKQMSPGGGSGAIALRKAIYQTSLDASFARSGACIGLLLHNQVSKFKKAKIVAPADRLGHSKKLKPLAAEILINDERFASVPRMARKELTKLDGAVVLYPDGRFYAAGAILKLGVTNIGNQGGRSAAAKTLSHYGLGMKVSEDGMISGFKKAIGDGEPAFKVG